MELPCGVHLETYAKDMAIARTRWQWLFLIFLVVALAVFPFFADSYLVSVTIFMMISVVASLGLNLLTGYAGQISLGHAAFVGVGAYTSGILAAKLAIPFPIALLGGGMMAGMTGIIFGSPSLRVKGFYLAVATLAAQFLINYIIIHIPSLTNGPIGLDVPRPRLGSIDFKDNRYYYLLVLSATIIMVIFAKNLERTRPGRAWVAIRDRDLAAAVMGIDLFKYKLLAFFVGCFYAGIAGSLYAHYVRVITPEHFTLLTSIWYLGYVIVGGMGSTIGPIFGVVFIAGLLELTGHVVMLLGSVLPYGGSFVVAARQMVFGLIVILFLIFEARGLAHSWDLVKRYYRLWPFAY